MATQLACLLHSQSLRCCSDTANLANETLEAQYELVQQRTSNNFTFQQGSHVLQFGSKIIDEEPAGDYLGVPESGVYTFHCARSYGLLLCA